MGIHTRNKNRIAYSHKIKLLLACLIIFIIDVLISIPMTVITLPKSMYLTTSIYQRLSVILKTTSPGKIIVDDNGIPAVDYGYKNEVYLGVQYNPLVVASVANANYEKIGKDKNAKEEFKKCIDWLIKAKEDRGSYYMWPYMYEGSYGSFVPWYSALAQIHILLAFQNAYQLDPYNYNKDLIERTLQALDVEIKNGGLMYQEINSNGKWFAEYVGTGRTNPPFILNGHMEVLLVLNDFYKKTGSLLAKDLFNDGIVSLLSHLHEYDTGKWSYYDREGNLAYDYHYTHVEELEILYSITNVPLIIQYQNKWDRYFPINPMWARKRFASFLLVFVCNYLILSIVYLLLHFIGNSKKTLRSLPQV